MIGQLYDLSLRKRHLNLFKALLGCCFLLLSISAFIYSAGRGFLPDFLWKTLPLTTAQIRPETGYCYTAFLGDTQYSSHLSPSLARLLENGVPLPYANIWHDEIRKQGHGRYSFWYDTIYFSSSDNTNPLENGRNYAIHVPIIRVTSSVALLIYGLTAISLILLLTIYFPKVSSIVAINLALIALLAYTFEYSLRFIDPSQYLPVNGLDANGNYITWGHLVINNKYGFRERNFESPKPNDTCRIMVLGDSLTWGAGLAVEERYTNLVEKDLQQTFPDKKIAVLNFALPGKATIDERDWLKEYKDLVQPDQIVIGYVLNDPQPKSQDYSLEKEIFDQKYGIYSKAIETRLKQVNLSKLSQLFNKAFYNGLEWFGIIPSWQVGLQRTYEETSPEWIAFSQALKDIKRMSDEMGLPPPILVILNQGTYSDRPTNYVTTDSTLQVYLNWYHQVERTAQEQGFITYNHEEELAKFPPNEPMAINFLDGHPNAKVNQIYAQKLFKFLAHLINGGELCQ